MKSDWDSRAATEAFFAIDSDVQHESTESFYLRGKDLVPKMIEPVLDRLGVTPAGLTVLEIGCGMGRLFPGLNDYFGEIIGVDVSSNMIQKGREACPVNATWVQGDGVSLSGVESASVDYVLTFEVFQHIPSGHVIAAYFQEIARVLRPGGSFQTQLRKGSDSKPQSLVRHLPKVLQNLVFFVLRLFKRIGITSIGNVPMNGSSETWMGIEIPPHEGLQMAEAAGLVDLFVVSDELHANNMGYWIAGRRPDS